MSQFAKNCLWKSDDSCFCKLGSDSLKRVAPGPLLINLQSARGLFIKHDGTKSSSLRCACRRDILPEKRLDAAVTLRSNSPDDVLRRRYGHRFIDAVSTSASP